MKTAKAFVSSQQHDFWAPSLYWRMRRPYWFFFSPFLKTLVYRSFSENEDGVMCVGEHPLHFHILPASVLSVHFCFLICFSLALHIYTSTYYMLSFSFPFVVRWSAYLLRRGKVCLSCGIPCYSSGTRCWAAGSSESGGKLSRRCGCGIWSRRTLYATSSSIQRCMPSSRSWNEGSRVEISHQALLLTSFWKFTPPYSDGRPFHWKLYAEAYLKDITERLSLITFDFFLLFLIWF